MLIGDENRVVKWPSALTLICAHPLTRRGERRWLGDSPLFRLSAYTPKNWEASCLSKLAMSTLDCFSCAETEKWPLWIAFFVHALTCPASWFARLDALWPVPPWLSTITLNLEAKASRGEKLALSAKTVDFCVTGNTKKEQPDQGECRRARTYNCCEM